jgi:enterochelin esterase family protein
MSMITRAASLILGFVILMTASPAEATLFWSRSFDSPALGGPMKYSIYLPSGYHDPKQQKTRYPVVYLLHGVGDNERAWPRLGRVESTADRMIATGEFPPVIIVMPASGKSWYVDSGAIGGPGDFATAVRDDLRLHVEATYRALADRGGRFIAGFSMGGYGALRLAFTRPDLYLATAAMSSALWWRLTPQSRLNAHQEKIFDGSFGRPFDPVRFMARRPDAYLDDVKNFTGHLGIYPHAGDDDRFATHVSTMKLYMAMRAKGLIHSVIPAVTLPSR